MSEYQTWHTELFLKGFVLNLCWIEERRTWYNVYIMENIQSKSFSAQHYVRYANAALPLLYLIGTTLPKASEQITTIFVFN